MLGAYPGLMRRGWLPPKLAANRDWATVAITVTLRGIGNLSAGMQEKREISDKWVHCHLICGFRETIKGTHSKDMGKDGKLRPRGGDLLVDRLRTYGSGRIFS